MCYISIFKLVSCFLVGLFDCHDPSTDSRNISLREFKKQIEEDNVSGEANTCLGIFGSRKYPYPHHGGNWKFQRGGGGGSKTQEIPEGRGVG